MKALDSYEWQVLSTYESADILIRLYARLHEGAKLSGERASEIASWFSQGREYFAASKVGGPLVRPVLQYYGALGLARGTILLLHNGSNHGLSESHGLMPKGWTNTLRNSADRMKVSLDISKGTFLSLADATHNRNAFTYVKKFSVNNFHEQLLPLDGLKDASFSLQDTLARISELGMIYHRCTDISPSALTGSISITELNGVVLGIDTPLSFTHDALRQEFALSESWTPCGRMLHSYCFLLVNESDWTSHVPHIEELANGGSAIVAPYPNGFNLSRLLRIHLLSAFLGTYARYHPEPWMIAVQGRAKGDHFMPLIRAAMDLIDVEYPRLIVRELEDRA